MSKPAFTRDGILTSQERLDSARKCLRNIEEHLDELTDRERSFVADMVEKSEKYGVSERQLAFLRDINEKY